jgi:hypothetical protein
VGKEVCIYLNVQTAAMFVRRQNIQHRQLVLLKVLFQERIANGHVRDPRRPAQHGIEKVDGDPRMFRAPQQPLERKVNGRVNTNGHDDVLANSF